MSDIPRFLTEGHRRVLNGDGAASYRISEFYQFGRGETYIDYVEGHPGTDHQITLEAIKRAVEYASKASELGYKDGDYFLFTVFFHGKTKGYKNVDYGILYPRSCENAAFYLDRMAKRWFDRCAYDAQNSYFEFPDIVWFERDYFDWLKACAPQRFAAEQEEYEKHKSDLRRKNNAGAVKRFLRRHGAQAESWNNTLDWYRRYNNQN